MPNQGEILNPSEEPEKPKEASRQEATKEDGLTPEEREQAAYWLALVEESPVPEEKREAGEDILALEADMSRCELLRPIEDLYSVSTPREIRNRPGRIELKNDLIGIIAKLNALEKETDVSVEKLTELKAKYQKLSNAVGFINSGKVDHNR